MMRLTIALALLILSASASAAIYRCTQPDGTTRFSEIQCGRDSQRVKIRPEYQAPPPGSAPEASASPVAEDAPETQHHQRQTEDLGPWREPPPGVESCPSKKQIEKAIFEHRVLVCMTPDEVRHAAPIRHDEYSVEHRILSIGVSVEQWYYSEHAEGWPALIMWRQGMVAGWE